jgi:xanthine/uracil permease
MENKETKQNTFFKKKLFGRISILALLGIVVGATGGYLYYSQVGCVSGTCAITSNPWMSIAWGGAFGYLVFDMFSGKKQENQTDHITSSPKEDLD